MLSRTIQRKWFRWINECFLRWHQHGASWNETCQNGSSSFPATQWVFKYYFCFWNDFILKIISIPPCLPLWFLVCVNCTCLPLSSQPKRVEKECVYAFPSQTIKALGNSHSVYFIQINIESCGFCCHVATTLHTFNRWKGWRKKFPEGYPSFSSSKVKATPRAYRSIKAMCKENGT